MVLDLSRHLPTGKLRRRTRRKLRKVVSLTAAALFGSALLFVTIFIAIGDK